MKAILDENADNQAVMVYLAAYEYAAQGIFVVPIRPDNSKALPEKKYHINYGSATRKKAVIDNWFNPLNGRFKGYNIGIACGRKDGVFVLDIDHHGDKDGYEDMANFESLHGEIPKCPVAETPNGGQHWLLKWRPWCTSSTAKIAPAVDTRGGREDACGGHIVVFPSVVNGKRYMWSMGGEIPETPDFVVLAMGGSPNGESNQPFGQSGTSRGNENVGVEDLEENVPIEQLSAMLDSIDIDALSYDQWLRIGQALNSQHPSDGLDVWENWSQRGVRYKEGECHSRWQGFDPAGNVRIGTIFYFAKEGGWEASEEDIQPTFHSELMGKLNAEYALVIVGGKTRIIKEKKSYPGMLGARFDLLTSSDFRTLMINRVHPYIDSTGKPKSVSEAEIWLSHKDRREYHNGMGLFPGDTVPYGMYNMWQGWEYPPIGGPCDLFFDHILNIICNGNEEHYIWTVDWMASGIQDPERPPGTAIVLKGQEGTGKGTFADTYGRLFGNHYVHLIDDTHLTGNFNAHLTDALLVFADEIVWGGNKRGAGKLKGLVTERSIIAERKGIDAVQSKNMIRMIMASNEDWVIPAGPQSRRWAVFELPNTYRQNTEYFKAIRDQLKDGGMSAIMHFLTEREIVTDLTKAPHTEALEYQRTMYQSSESINVWWGELINNQNIMVPDENNDYQNQPDWVGNRMTVDRDVLYHQYLDWCIKMGGRKESKTGKWQRTMEKYGVKFIRTDSDGSRRWMCEVPSWGRASRTYSQSMGVRHETES